jgi:hypothetical protein
LKKVADYQHREFVGSSAELAEKIAGRTVLASILKKVADIDKIVTGVGIGSEGSKSGLTGQWVDKVVPKVLSNYKPIDNADLGWLSGKNFPRVLATLSEMGIFLSTPEFLDIFFMKATGLPAPKGLARKLISMQGDLFRMMADNPKIVEFVLDSGLLGTPDTKPLPEVRDKMSSYIPSRSWSADNLKTASSTGLRTLTYTDPNTGRVHVSTEDSAESADETMAMANTLGLLGSLALAGGTYLALSPIVPSAGLKALLGVGAGALSLPHTISDPRMRTDRGEDISAITPFTERRASWEPQLSLALASNYALSPKAIGTRVNGSSSLCKTAAALGDGINVDALVNNLGYLLSLG